MCAKRKDLIDRMAFVYGVDHPIVKQFSILCNRYSNTPWNDDVLRLIVESHESMSRSKEG